jgi:dTDP-4-amino-4,6-dideoxygalactose transaminase
MDSPRVHLSPPTATEEDIEAVVAAMRSGWVAPAGPDLTAFESDVADYLGVAAGVALSSGTAALHLALQYTGVRAGDVVIVPTVTFAATAFPIRYLGATPLFVDIDESWNLNPALLERAVTQAHAAGQRVAAVIPVDLYGTPAHYTALSPILESLGVPMLEDAAEGLGARFGDRPVGTLGSAGILSFNGNKIITTSGGGMLVTDSLEMAERVRHWSTQAREPLPWYEHREIGFNYRLSNLLAALGRSQFARIDSEVARRRQLRDSYRARLTQMPGVTVQDDPAWGTSNAWLSVARFDAGLYPDASTRIRERLEEHNIESRPIWKPLHQQPVFADCPRVLTGAADALFAEGLCLPSGPAMDEGLVDHVTQVIHGVLTSR